MDTGHAPNGITVQRRWRFVAIAFVALLAGLWGLYGVAQKGTIPQEIRESIGHYVVSIELREGDGGSSSPIPVRGSQELQLILDRYAIGDEVRLRVEDDSYSDVVDVRLSNQYTIWAVAIFLSLGLLYLSLGLFVAWRKSEVAVGKRFFLLMTVASLLLMTTPGRLTIAPEWSAYVTRLLFLASYCFVGPLFIHFVLLFPIAQKWRAKINVISYSLGGVFFLTASTLFLLFALSQESFEHAASYVIAEEGVRGFFILTALFGLALMSKTYRTLKTVRERKQFRWVAYGTSISVIGFLLLWLIPERLGGVWNVSAPVSEEVAHISLVVAPVAFAIGIVKHQLLDIDLLIKKTTTYGLALVGVISLYLAVVAIAADFVARVEVVATVLVALAFEPLRRLSQVVIDRVFFRTEYNYAEAEHAAGEAIAQCNSVECLGDTVGQQMIETFQPEHLFVVVSSSNDRSEIYNSGPELDSSIVDFLSDRSIDGFHEITPLPHSTNSQSSERESQLRSSGVKLWITTDSEETGSRVIVGLSERKSGQSYHPEDQDLIASVCRKLSVTFDKILLGQRLNTQKEISERLRELSAMQSRFVSSVSHEFRTPLTGIKLYAELMSRADKLGSESISEYSKSITIEADRLTHLIDNVLDFSKIDRVVTSRGRDEIDLNDVVHEVARVMELQLNAVSAELVLRCSEDRLDTVADAESMRRAIINLISNAMKYTGAKKRIEVSTFTLPGWVGVAVSDNGIGLNKEEQMNLFEPFYRSEFGAKYTSGTGLGLTIVRDIVQSHGGMIEVDGQRGEGATFRILIPALAMEE